MTVKVQQVKTGLVADDFFLMANDDPAGRPRLSERILALGLAGALLGELLLQDVVAIEHGNLIRTTNRPPLSPLHAQLCREVEEEIEPRRVRDWLNYLSQESIDRVGQRLEGAGLVRFQRPRLKMPGTTGRWVPIDMQVANGPAVDVTLKIYNAKAQASTLLLFGLTRATGLDNPALDPIRQLLNDPALLKQTLSPLAVFNPMLVDLLAHIEAAVGSAVTSQRRA